MLAHSQPHRSPPMRASTGLTVPTAATVQLDGVTDALRRAGGDNLVALVVFGGVARGRYIEGASDINLAVVLREASGPALQALTEPLQDAWRAHRVEPLIVTQAEIPRLAVSFPTKLLDIQRTHLVLHGQNPFLGITVDREHVRARVEQELRNVALRKRQRLARIGNDPQALALEAHRAAAALAVNLRALLMLRGAVGQEFQPTLAIYDLAARTFGLDAEALAATKQAHEDPGTATMSADLFARLVATVARAADAAAGLTV
jgi:hypothetical protein